MRTMRALTFTTVFWLTALLCLGTFHARLASAADPPAKSESPDTAETPAAKEAPEDVPSSQRVERLEAQLADEKARLVELQGELEQRLDEYKSAESDLADLNAKIAETKKQLEGADDDAEFKRLKEELAADQERADLAEEQLRVIATKRETLNAVARGLEETIEKDLRQLAELNGEAPAADAPPADDAEKAEPETPTLEMPSLIPGVKAPEPSEPRGPREPVSEKAAEFQRKAEEKASRAEIARENVEEIARQRRRLENDIELEQQMIKAAKQEQELLKKSLAAQQKELEAKQQDDASADETNKLQQEIVEAKSELQRLDDEIERRSKQLQELQTQLETEKAQEQVAIDLAAQREREAQKALWTKWRVYATETIKVQGPLVLIVIGALVVAWFLARWFLTRMERLLVRRARGNREERELYAQTLVGVMRNATMIALIVGGIAVVVGIFQGSLNPMLGGAALVGLAVAFGAQNLIRDFFSGFMILLERQYKLHDIIRIGDMQGIVEGVTLRMTVLRNFDGHVYFIPNGEITSVVNLTHGWARVVLDVGVAYGEKVDDVIRVLMELAHELKQDVRYGPFILADPEMFGVDALADSSVIIRLGIKVRPDQQWFIKREMWRRIKNRFDELGIEIPFPQRTLHHRHDPPRVFAPESNGQNAGDTLP